MSEDRIVERQVRVRPESVRSLRVGHGANCSSIGSVIDTLFVSAVVASAVLAAVMAAMQGEAVTTLRTKGTPEPLDPPGSAGADPGASKNQS